MENCCFSPSSTWSPVISCLSISFSPFLFLNSCLEYSFKTTALRLNWKHALPASCLLQQPKNPESQAVRARICTSNSSRLQGGVLKPFFSFLLFLSPIFLSTTVNLISFKSELYLQSREVSLQPLQWSVLHSSRLADTTCWWPFPPILCCSPF